MPGIAQNTLSSQLGRRAQARIYLKVVLPALLAVLMFGFTVFFFIEPHMENMVLEARREMIRGIGRTGWQMVDNQALLEDLGNMDRRTAQSSARQVLRSFRYGPHGMDYFWVVDLNGLVQVNPFRTDMEGKSALSLHDDKGFYFIKKALEIAQKEGDGFLSYSWQKGDSGELKQKLVYVRLYVPWGWVIGTGIYLDDVESELRTMMNSLALVGFGVFLGVLLLSAYITMRQVRSEQARQEAEGALQETLDKYRAVQDAAPNPLVVYDGEGKVIYCNPAFSRVFGWHYGEVLGKRIDFVPPGEMEKTKAAIESVFSNPGSAITFDTRRCNKDRDILDVRISAATFRDIHGKPVGMIVNLADITETKASERALRSSEERYRHLFESANDAIVIFDKNGVEDCNQRALEMFGYSRDEFLGPYIDFNAPEKQPDGSNSLEAIKEYLRRAKAGEQISFEWQSYRKDGSLFDQEVSLQYVDLPGGPRFMSMARDVTARKSAEEALKESEERLRAFMNSNPLDIAVFKDGQGRWVEANHEMLRAFGLTGKDYQGKTSLELTDLARPEMRQVLLQGMELDAKALGSGQVTRDEVRLVDDNGRERIFDVIRVPLFHPDGRVRGISVVSRDITALMEAERQRKEMESQLRHSQKMEAIGTLAGGIAHDFNNILTAIIGYTETAMVKAGKGEDYTKGLKVVLDSSFRARDLVKQLLTFSRGREVTPQVLDMENVVGETMNLVKAVTPPMIKVHIQTKSSDTVVKADPVQMQQVVMNLCTNAIQAMEDDGGVLKVTLNKQRLSEHDIPLHPNLTPGDYVLLEVSDTGPGMDSEMAKKIFDPFFTTKPRDKGTGLGLSMVHGIVTSAGGAVLVDSRPGTGATFRVYLPRSFEHPEASSCEDELPLESSGEGTLLLVEDEPLVMRVEQEILESLGYHVVACSSPLEAREIFEDNPARFDLVITDYAMPNMSGLELASSLKESAPNIPVLLCTGYNQEITSHELKLFGVDQTLMKPFTARELSHVLQNMLNQKSQDDSNLAVS
jgi:two-component system cell cycle sensor histidine kinase/response regulator CckA